MVWIIPSAPSARATASAIAIGSTGTVTADRSRRSPGRVDEPRRNRGRSLPFAGIARAQRNRDAGSEFTTARSDS
jgi:hypothetical protein